MRHTKSLKVLVHHAITRQFEQKLCIIKRIFFPLTQPQGRDTAHQLITSSGSRLGRETSDRDRSRRSPPNSYRILVTRLKEWRKRWILCTHPSKGCQAVGNQFCHFPSKSVECLEAWELNFAYSFWANRRRRITCLWLQQLMTRNSCWHFSGSIRSTALAETRRTKKRAPSRQLAEMKSDSSRTSKAFEFRDRHEPVTAMLRKRPTNDDAQRMMTKNLKK